jgi:hypothetical protein
MPQTPGTLVSVSFNGVEFNVEPDPLPEWPAYVTVAGEVGDGREFCFEVMVEDAKTFDAMCELIDIRNEASLDLQDGSTVNATVRKVIYSGFCMKGDE